jgi:FtsP/CotA-like multicopper oxidase with cupredoxin domain
MAHSPDAVDLSTLTGPQTGEPDVAITLTARRDDVTIVDGPTVDGYTLNGSSPGPEIRATVGDLVEVRLINESVPDGVSLHWHGVDVPAAEDGVAGVTQDAVAPGGTHVYRFVAEDAGTYWYHSHQVSHEQVRDGLWGSLVVEPAETQQTSTWSPRCTPTTAPTPSTGRRATCRSTLPPARPRGYG